MSYTASNGEVIRGFFTESETADPELEKEALIKKAIDGHPEYEEIFRDLMNSASFNKIFNSQDAAFEALNDGLNKENLKNIAKKHIKKIISEKSHGVSDREANKIRQKYTGIIENITTNDEFAVRFYNFTKSCSGISDKAYFVKEGPKWDEKVIGKPYSPDMMADVAMALVKKNFTQRPDMANERKADNANPEANNGIYL